MENKAHAIAAGTFLLVVAALLVALAVWLTRDTGERHFYDMSTRDAITGLQPQAQVRFRGVSVGKVTYIGFDPQVQGNVLVRIAIDKDAPVTRSTFGTLSFQGVTGLAFVQLDDPETTSPRLVPNDANPPRIPLKPSLLSKLASQGEKILNDVEQVTTRVNQLLGPENQKAITSALAGVDAAAGNIGQLAKRMDSTVSMRIDPALARLPALTDQAGKTMQSVQAAGDNVSRTAADFDRTAERLNAQGGPLDKLSEGAATLSHSAETFGAATLPRLNKVSEDTSRAVRRLSRTVNAISDNPQSLIFGNGPPQPGPGEAGFTAPVGAPR